MVDYCDRSNKYVIQFDILEAGQTAKLSALNLSIITDGVDKENLAVATIPGKASGVKGWPAYRRGPRVEARALLLSHEANGVFASPAQKEASRRKRFGV